MGYIIGGRRGNLITSASESDFRQARQQATGVQSGLVKVDDIKSKRGGGMLQSKASLDVTRNAPMFNDPRYTSSTLAIPTDERTLHGLYRFFTETDPIIGAASRIHSEMPLADVSLSQCEDSGVQQHFEEMWENINGIKLMNDIAAEHFEIGNVYVFGAWNESTYMWEQFAILNPDYVKIEGTWVNEKPLIKLIPDEALRRIVQTESPEFLYKQLPKEIIQYVLMNQEIPLNPNNVFHLSNARRPYELKGKSPIKRVLKILMLEDRFNQANFALATRHAVPFTIVKVGDPNTGWIPSEGELEDIREAVAAHELDPNFTLIYHYGIDIQYYGASGKTLPVGPELDRIYKLKMIGLGIHEQLLTGSGGTYAQAYINLEVQRQRWLNLQLKFETLVHQGWFKPVADLCGFYRVKSAISMPGYSKSYKWGTEDKFKSYLRSQFSTIRDTQDNKEFQKFLKSKVSEWKTQADRQMREYVYPEIDWGALSAASDENLKNYMQWLAQHRPHLVDDATLARLGRLDRDTQEKAYIEDLKRAKKRWETIAREGLTSYVPAGEEGPAVPGGTGAPPPPPSPDAGDIDIDMGMEGAEPEMPVGVGGPPEAAEGEPPPGVESVLKRVSKQMYEDLLSSDLATVDENKELSKKTKNNKVGIIKNKKRDK